MLKVGIMSIFGLRRSLRQLRSNQPQAKWGVVSDDCGRLEPRLRPEFSLSSRTHLPCRINRRGGSTRPLNGYPLPDTTTRNGSHNRARNGIPIVHLLFLLAFLLLANPLAAGPLTITTEALSNAVAGVPYAQTLNASGGSLPYNWAIQAGGLPSLLTLNPTNGQITGIATASGSWVFSYPFEAYIVVTDAASNTAAQSFGMMVLPAPNTYFTLNVSNGSGSGFYLTNTIVSIAADAAPPGEVFENWTGATVANPFSASTTLAMPGSNVTVTAVYGVAPPDYPLTVVNGTGGGSFAANAIVTITADGPPAGQVFLDWTGAAVANAESSSTTLVMPAAPTTVTANYGAPAPEYVLVVINGSGSGNYPANTTVAISADAAPAGEVFGSWSGVAVANATSPEYYLGHAFQ